MWSLIWGCSGAVLCEGDEVQVVDGECLPITGTLTDTSTDTWTDTGSTDTGSTDTGTGQAGSPGCGQEAHEPAGGVQLAFNAGDDGDGVRGYFLSRPRDYDPDTPHALVFGYAGTDWTGEQIQPYLDLETETDDDVIYVYPDPLWRTFTGWGEYGGWVLGPHAAPADGMGDLVFTEALLDALRQDWCVDDDRVFTTGHSWGGDMAAVVACFLGDRFTASVPVAANQPYWFEPTGGEDFSCTGSAAVWTFFGSADDHFTWQDYPGQFGDAQDAFWREEHGCADTSQTLDYGREGDCVAWDGCHIETRYCLYGPNTGHQVPSYYGEAAMGWFTSF
jgi:polyhydroxybutyrate depolymerase